MKLNEDDFWESLETRLQITVFPPYAAILRWRGKGKFKASSDVASNLFTGLVLTEACREEGKEIFPDEDAVIEDKFDLEQYLNSIHKNMESFLKSTINPKDPEFEKQQFLLEGKSKKDFDDLFSFLKRIEKKSGDKGRPRRKFFISLSRSGI